MPQPRSKRASRSVASTETTMDPKVRSLLQVTVEDGVEADNIFSILMGDQVKPRRDFIETNALKVRSLDV